MELVVVRITPQQWSVAWRPEAKRLVLPVPGNPAVRQRVAVCVELPGHILRATVLGTIVRKQRDGARIRAEVALDANSAGAVAMLDAAARGEPISIRARPRRYLLQIPVSLVGRQSELFMTTANLSTGGCSLRWSGATPSIGTPILLRFGVGLSRTDVEGSVRWVRSDRENSVGVRFTDPRSAGLLAGILRAAERSNAPTL
jgi:hypothetical protein